VDVHRRAAPRSATGVRHRAREDTNGAHRVTLACRRPAAAGRSGNAIKPYYGRTAGNRPTALLKEHILGAVALLQAAKSGDQTQIATASTAWYANANQIADFLHAANPDAWSRTTMRAMMKTHLDQTLAEAQHRLQGNFAADIRDYDAVHRHILEMADTLSTGIMRQFPKRFR
jgi:hypothetical protein